MMRFLDIEFFPFMLLPSLILLYLVITNKGILERIFDPDVLKKIRLDQGMSKKMRLVTLFIALFFMIVALARPVYQKGVVEVATKRAYVVVALDVSASMKVSDLYPNRLEFAKKKIEEFIKKSENLSIGIVAFAKDAFIVSPPTDDKETLLYMLRRLDTSVLKMKGTNIKAALLSAKLLLKGVKDKNILLVTDGGDQKNFSSEIAIAKDGGFKVYVLGVGTQKGAPLKMDGELVKDEKGNIRIFKLNEAIKKLANATGGKFVQATLSNEDILQLLKSIDRYHSATKRKKIVDQRELYPYVLIIALLFLFLAFFDIPTKNLAFLWFVILPLHAGVLDFKHIKNASEAYKSGHYERAVREFEQVAKSKQNAQSYYDLANAYYKAGEYEKALHTYEKVETEDRELEFNKLYNMGNSYFKLGQFQKAIEMYEKALKIKEDSDAKYNLELAKKMLKKKSQKSKNDQQKQQSSKKKQQNSKKSEKSQNKSKEQSKKGGAKKSEQKPGHSKPAPIPDREEKKWQRQIQERSMPTLLYKAPIKTEKEESNENPW